MGITYKYFTLKAVLSDSVLSDFLTFTPNCDINRNLMAKKFTYVLQKAEIKLLLGNEENQYNQYRIEMPKIENDDMI